MKKFLCLSALMGVLLTSGGIASATEALNLDVPEDHTAIYGGGMEATEEGFSSSKLRYAAGGGDFNCGVNGFNRIRQKSPILYRWVMNAVRYEGYRW
ncbi:hypothetical protein [Enterococcus faecium]|uniref:hypothetical protein n=1 Tax=Enterococcus faecium TaxID=1352 RepID=UPI000F83ABF3|nr:hypothetical protein [Enterococcus faecium]